MFKHFSGFIFLFIFLFSRLSTGTIIHIPADAATIQAGIDMAQSHDTVLVDEGTYYENILFRGKSIVVSSRFILDHNPDHIINTVINGSQSTNPDSASCVMFYGEDSNAILQGFTITGGRGTRYTLSDLKTTTKYDGKITVEGGGLFFNESAATAQFNLIINNEAASIKGYNYNGGGGISTFCGNPKICNNVIMNNKAVQKNNTYSYAAGIVFNESHGIIRNNIIYHNITSGRGALFTDINVSVIVENNTIIGNVCNRDAAGIFNRTPKSVFMNNIVWGNIETNDQILGMDNDDIFEYCFTDQSFNNKATIFNIYPEFSESKFTLKSNSPCVDSGNPDTTFNEAEDVTNPGYAKLPSLGSTRNDIGAYGGPFADIFPDFYNEDIYIPANLALPATNIDETSSKEIKMANLSTIILHIDSITVNNKDELSLNNITGSVLGPIQTGTIEVNWKPQQAGTFNDTLKIYHNLTNIPNPAIIKIKGTALEATAIPDDRAKAVPLKFNLKQNFPNPFNPATHIEYSIARQEHVSLKLFDILGREIKTLVHNVQHPGKYQVVLDGSQLPGGVYFYYLKAGRFSDSKKLVLLK